MGKYKTLLYHSFSVWKHKFNSNPYQSTFHMQRFLHREKCVFSVVKHKFLCFLYLALKSVYNFKNYSKTSCLLEKEWERWMYGCFVLESFMIYRRKKKKLKQRMWKLYRFYSFHKLLIYDFTFLPVGYSRSLSASEWTLSWR